jgi:hypothetical protein
MILVITSGREFGRMFLFPAGKCVRHLGTYSLAVERVTPAIHDLELHRMDPAAEGEVLSPLVRKFAGNYMSSLIVFALVTYLLRSALRFLWSVSGQPHFPNAFFKGNQDLQTVK